MGKSKFFFGHSVFGQLISLINRMVVSQAVTATKSDRYCKRFTTWDHLVTLLFATLGGCTSLREVHGGLLGLKGKTEHLGLGHICSRSTLSDANIRRTPKVFENIYNALIKQNQSILSDSRLKAIYGKSVVLLDSTTVTLFKEILRAAGRKSLSGKQKGGIKVHAVLNPEESVPRVIYFSPSASSDVKALGKTEFSRDNIYVFDRGYLDIVFFEKLTTQHISFVTRQKDNSTFESLREIDIPAGADDGVLKDEIIQVPIRKNGQIMGTTTLRRVAYWDKKQEKLLVFITNIIDMDSEKICQLYKERWKIELMFKQLKQNFPLKYFLGDNENAIVIQIWSALIANLLLTVIGKKVQQRSWSFSNIATFCRIHLFNYIHLINFLNAPERDWQKSMQKQLQLELSG